MEVVVKNKGKNKCSGCIETGKMMTAADKVKRFKILLLSPHKLTEGEIRVLWNIARCKGNISYLIDDPDPIIWVNHRPIPVARHIIGTLERRGILKRRPITQHTPGHNGCISFITWKIIWKKMKTFPQLKELMIQIAIGSL